MVRARFSLLAVVTILLVALLSAACRPVGFRPATLKPEDVPSELRAAFLAAPETEDDNLAWHAFGECAAGTILAATWTYIDPNDGKESRMWGVALWRPDQDGTPPAKFSRWVSKKLRNDRTFDAGAGQGSIGSIRWLRAGGYALAGEVDRVVVSTNFGREVATELCDGWWMITIEGADAGEELAVVQALDRSGKILHDYMASWQAR